jgi:cytochrome c-type protein NapC
LASPTPIGIVALLTALLAAAILVVYLVKKPRTTLTVKLWMFLGLGVFPAIAGASSTVAGMEKTTEREFCGSCHVMTAHYEDASNPASQSLAARHSRNPFFGDRSCYVCHADYGMYGYAMTKAGGMRHVYEYYLRGYKDMPLEEAVRTIRIRKPYDNTNCRQCHTTSLHDWRRVPDHESLKAELETNRVSCASAGCHGFAHPFSKPESAKATAPTHPPASPPAASGSAR